MNVLRAGTPLRVGGHALLPVERVWVRAGEGWAAGGREVVAVVVVDAAGSRALDTGGGAADLDALTRDVAGLAEWLDNETDRRGGTR